MIITKRHLPRRTVLRGLGAGLALPLLDSMVPAFAAQRTTAAKPVPRLGVVYVPNGMSLPYWTPQAEGTTFAMTPILEPLTPFRDRLTIMSGFANAQADVRQGDGGGDHTRAQAVFLTGVYPHKTEGPDIRNGISMDQIAAQKFGAETQLASLELALEANDMIGGCDSGYACAYTATLAWRTPTTPLPSEKDPRAVFERLFGADTTDPRVRLARMRQDASILDAVTEQMNRLRRELGPGDQQKVAEYLDSVRDIERRIQKAREQSGRDLPVVEPLPGIPPTYEEHAKVMFDLMALAYQADLTRVATFLMGREVSNRTYPEIGVPDQHHSISHHQERPENLATLAKINTFHTTLFGHLLEKLRSTQDGDGTLLDHSMILYGSGIGNSNRHDHYDLPIFVAGAGDGRLKGGRHLRVPDRTPLMNLHLSLLDKMGVPVETLGDSTGRVTSFCEV